MDILRFITCGSVDDGKSTLIGRLLLDSKAILDDHYAELERTSLARGRAGVDLSLITDGLKAEREQGITIDVAYRYFSTQKRRFVIIDCPGHVQYTRNMVTGASNANLAVILVDAKRGVREQTRRHSFISSLLRLNHLVVCVNKMDEVGYSEEVFNKIRADFEEFAPKLEIRDLEFIPISALLGDNVVSRSEKMPWFQGAPLLPYLENVYIGSEQNLVDFRLSVQATLLPRGATGGGQRRYAGSIDSGILREGDEIIAFPGAQKSLVTGIFSGERRLREAVAPMAVSVELRDEIDISRGSILARERNQPREYREVDAQICWLDDKPLNKQGRYLLRHGTSVARCLLSEIQYKIDLTALARSQTDSLEMNDVGRATFRLSQAIFADTYSENKQTGCAILVDEVNNRTVGALMLR